MRRSRGAGGAALSRRASGWSRKSFPGWLASCRTRTSPCAGCSYTTPLAMPTDERLKEKAERFEESRQLLDEVETALYVLTMRLIDKELYAVFGERVIRKTRRRRTMEESYREIHRVFEGGAGSLSSGIGTTAIKRSRTPPCGARCTRSTVERAARFVETSRARK